MYKISKALQKYSDPVLYSVIFLFHSITTTTCYTIIIKIIRIWKLNHWFLLPGHFEDWNKLSRLFVSTSHISAVVCCSLRPALHRALDEQQLTGALLLFSQLLNKSLKVIIGLSVASLCDSFRSSRKLYSHTRAKYGCQSWVLNMVGFQTPSFFISLNKVPQLTEIWMWAKQLHFRCSCWLSISDAYHHAL